VLYEEKQAMCTLPRKVLLIVWSVKFQAMAGSTSFLVCTILLRRWWYLLRPHAVNVDDCTV